MTARTSDGPVRGFGLTFASALPIPGAMAGPAPEEPDIAIELGVAPPWTPTLIDEPYRAASPDLFDFTMPGLARFTCIERRRVLVDALPGADPDDVADMLIATALPALLWARGGVVLHAAAAVLPGATTATAVAGDSGSGKSTWLAAAVARGASVVADDSVLVRIADGQVVVSGLPGGYFRRAPGDPTVRTFQPVPPERQVADYPLGAITILRPDTPARQLSGSAAVAALLRQRHRPRIARLLGLEGAGLATIAQVARTVPVTLQPVNQPVNT